MSVGYLPHGKLYDLVKDAIELIAGKEVAERTDAKAMSLLTAIADYVVEFHVNEKGYDHTNVKAFFVRSRKGVEYLTFWTHELTDYKHLANQMKILMQLDEDDEIESISRIAAGTMKKLPTGTNVFQCEQVMSHGIARAEWDENFDEWLAKQFKEAKDEEVSS